MKLKRLGGSTVISLAMLGAWPALTQAQRVELLLSAGPEAETPEQVVQAQVGRGMSTSAIANAISISGASAVEYLLPERARGEFAQRLKQNPSDARAQLERYLVLTFPERSDLDAVIKQLSATPGVAAVFKSTPVEFFEARAGASVPNNVSTQYHLNALRIPPAWQWNGGYGVVEFLDNGVEVNHPDLRAFGSSGNFLGGNLLSIYSMDLGPAFIPIGGVWGWDFNHVDLNPDEAEPVISQYSIPQCDPDGDGYLIPAPVGHGTHVAGIVGANASNGDATQGVCEHCGLGMIKITGHYCQNFGAIGVARLYPDSATVARALTIATDGTGAQVINMSFATTVPSFFDHCPPPPEEQRPICAAIQHAADKDIVLVGASGNNRATIQFPARDPRVVAVGGLNESLAFWDEGASGLQNCPTPNSAIECGSNYSMPTDPSVGAKQELVAPAKNVISTFYHGKTWNPSCSDPSWGLPDDGIGSCTGTSMSAPMVSGIIGLLRSTNPLVPAGDPEVSSPRLGIRDVLVRTTDRAQVGLGWDPKLGYGRPDAERAVRRMLAVPNAPAPLNRLTPLFRLYSAVATDNGYVTSPQVAVSMRINDAAPYVPKGVPARGYSQFPGGVSEAPRADAYVLTTPVPWSRQSPPTVALYLIDRERAYPVGCTPDDAGCDTHNRDWNVAAGVSDMRARVAEGYTYRGIQGYILARCVEGTACTEPDGAEALYRKCRPSSDDCAVFLARDFATMTAAGFIRVQGTPADGVLGYAFPNVDTDGDTLIDGFEYLLGTLPKSPDSDHDSCADGTEYPPAGVPVSNPLSPPGPADC